jgi:hypothetical protein
MRQVLFAFGVSLLAFVLFSAVAVTVATLMEM